MKIAIASGKGGTGKTTLSTNLASLLAESRKVILSDLDVEEPNSGLFLSGKTVHEEERFRMVPTWKKDRCTLCGLCQDVCNFHAVIKLGKEIMVFPELCHGCYACSELCPTNALPMIPESMGVLKQIETSSFTFIVSKLHIGQEQAVPLIAQTIEYVDEHFSDEYVKIYDSPPGTSCPVIEAIKDVDFVILVTEPTPFGLHDLTLAVETTRGLNKPFGVVINRSGIGDSGVLDYCEREQIPILAAIPNSRAVAEHYSRGELVFESVPEVRSELEKLRTYLDGLKEGGAA